MKTFKALTQLSLATMLLTWSAVPQAMAQSLGTATEQVVIQEEINRDFHEAAQHLARALSDPAFRRMLWSEIQASRDKEKILDFKAMLTKAKDHAALAVSPQALLEQLQAVDAIEEKMRAAQFPEELVGVNLYFPEESHRQQWRGDEELLVAFDPVQDESEVTSIIAYSVKTGEQLLLGPGEVPSVPTLVIAARERSIPQLAVPSEPPSPLPPQEDVENPTLTGGNYIGIPYMMIHNDHEPWYKGKPEIYMLVGQSDTTIPREHRIELNSGKYDVNTVGKKYGFGDGPSSPLYFYFDEDYSDATYFHVLESDSGGSTTIKAGVSYKGVDVGLEWTVSDEDDSLGYRYVHKSEVPFPGYITRSTGDATLWIDKD